MPKSLLTLLVALLLGSTVRASVANTKPGESVPQSSLFQDDRTAFDRELEGLEQLENLVENRQVSASQLAAEGNPLLRHLAKNDDLAASLLGVAAPKDERLLGIPGFLWGFCLGATGVIIVYVAIDDPEVKKREGKQAIIGCAVATVVGIVIYALLIASAANSSTTTTTNDDSCN